MEHKTTENWLIITALNLPFLQLTEFYFVEPMTGIRHQAQSSATNSHQQPTWKNFKLMIRTVLKRFV